MQLHNPGGIRLVVCDEPAQAQPWNNFLCARSPHVHIEQTIDWGNLKQIYGWKPVWVWASRGSQVLGGSMILTRRIRGLGTIAYVERGPVWDSAEPGAVRFALEAVHRFAEDRRIAYLVITPPYDGDELVPHLETHGFRVKPERMPPHGVGRATLLVDLRPDLDAILASMSMTKRQNIRRGLRKGVRVRTGDAADAETVRRLMWEGCKRRGIGPSPAQPDYFQNFWRVLGIPGRIKFFIAEINGEPVSAACVLLCCGAMQLWRVGWSGKHDGCDPNDVLHWEMMKWAKENGCHEFDFLHIRPDHARAIFRGEKIKDSYSGVTEYKMSFGGQLRLLPEIYYRSFHPAIQPILSWGAARFGDSDLSVKLLDKAAKMLRASRAS